MTREEQIKKAAHDFSWGWCDDKAHPLNDGFIEGAKWADQHPHWIPVEKELPKETGWYLVATPTLNSKIDVALWDGKWRRLVTITHWMPLPEEPRKGDKE